MKNSYLVNRIFGRLTVNEYNGCSKWKCTCSCGNTSIVRTSDLTRGRTKSCGCLRGENTKGNKRNYGFKNDLTNKKFGAIQPIEYIKGGKWKCVCDCGNIIIAYTRDLNAGHIISCGCLKSKKISDRLTKDMSNFEDENIKVLSRDGSSKRGVAMWKVLCKRCGSIFVTRGSNIRNGCTKSCGCVKSYNEIKISEILSKYGYEFKREYTFDDLKSDYGKRLRFDFAIFKNGKLSYLIEYNGKQHYIKPKNKWGDRWEINRNNDNKKIEYCKNHGINLRIIKYDELYSEKDIL